eukprot:g24182.t1
MLLHWMPCMSFVQRNENVLAIWMVCFTQRTSGNSSTICYELPRSHDTGRKPGEEQVFRKTCGQRRLVPSCNALWSLRVLNLKLKIQPHLFQPLPLELQRFPGEFFLEKMDDDPLVWEILSWLLFHWFPRNQTAGWGWWRVGWSWSEWWKVVERLLGKAQSFPQSALGMLKDAMIRMQEQKGCKRIFLKAFHPQLFCFTPVCGTYL